MRYVDGIQHMVFAETDPATGTTTIIEPGSYYLNAGSPRYVYDSTIAFVRHDQTQHPQLWLRDLRTQANRCLTCGDDYTDGCSFFDVNHVTGEFVYTRTSYGGLWVIDAAGTNPRQITDPPWPLSPWNYP